MLDRLIRVACAVAVILVGLETGVARAQDEVFVANLGNFEGLGQSITVYARTANGNVAPTRTISGNLTGVNAPTGVAVDRANNELVVLDFGGVSGDGAILIHSLTANGNVAPLRTITGLATGLAGGPWGLALDTIHNEIVVANGSPSLTVYARTANGNVTPLRTISGAATGLSRPSGPAVDTVHDELFVANQSNNSITVYARTANGNVTPLRTITGAATGLSGPMGLIVDTVHDELVVANGSAPFSVTVYPRTADGDVAPLRTITGANSPFAVTVDTVHDELAVAEAFVTGGVSVYARTATGGATPLRTITGPGTGLYVPVSVATSLAAPASDYYTVTPCRLLDTRDPVGPYGGPALSALGTRSFVLAGGSAPCGIPATARAVAMNVTAIQPTTGGFLTIYAGGSPRPPTSTINTNEANIRANNAIVALGPAGDITVYCVQATGTVDLIVDVSGYFQ